MNTGSAAFAVGERQLFLRGGHLCNLVRAAALSDTARFFLILIAAGVAILLALSVYIINF